MKKLILGFLFVAVGILAFGAGSKEGATQKAVTLKWLFWYPEPTELIQAYEKDASGVTISYEQVGGNNFNKVLNTRLMAGEAPDLYVPYYKETYLQQAADGGIVDLSNQPFVKALDPSAVNLNSINGKLYAFPIESTAICIFYNKDIFNKYNIKLPTNYQEFYDACVKLKQAGVAPLVQGMADLWQAKYSAGFNQLSAVLYLDPNWLTKLNEGTAKWTDPVMLKQYQKKAQFFKAGLMHPDSLSLNFDQAWQVFCTGGAAMIGAGTFALNNVFGKIQPQFAWDVFPTPVNEAGNPQKLEYFASNSLLVVNGKGPNVQKALDFVNWLSTGPAQKLLADKWKVFTSAKDMDLSFDPAAQKFKKLFAMDKFQFEREPVYLSSEFGKTVQSLYLGQMTPEQVVQELQKKTDASIKK